MGLQSSQNRVQQRQKQSLLSAIRHTLYIRDTFNVGQELAYTLHVFTTLNTRIRVHNQRVETYPVFRKNVNTTYNNYHYMSRQRAFFVRTYLPTRVSSVWKFSTPPSNLFTHDSKEYITFSTGAYTYIRYLTEKRVFELQITNFHPIFLPKVRPLPALPFSDPYLQISTTYVTILIAQKQQIP